MNIIAHPTILRRKRRGIQPGEPIQSAKFQTVSVNVVWILEITWDLVLVNWN